MSPRTSFTTGTTPSTSRSGCAVPGFLNAERWIGSGNPKDSVALYDLDNCRRVAQPALPGGRRRQRLALDQAGDRPRQASHPARRRADPARRRAGAGRRRAGAAADRDECRARAREPNSTNGTTSSTCRRSARRARRAVRRGATAAAARRSAMRRSIISRNPDVPNSAVVEDRRRTRRGPSACGRISATTSGSTAAGISAAKLALHQQRHAEDTEDRTTRTRRVVPGAGTRIHARPPAVARLNQCRVAARCDGHRRSSSAPPRSSAFPAVEFTTEEEHEPARRQGGADLRRRRAASAARPRG